MHDNASCHKVHLITDWMEKNTANYTIWPAQSSDLSPIEKLWDTLNDLWENILSEIIKTWSHQCHN